MTEFDYYGCVNCEGTGWLDERTWCPCPLGYDMEHAMTGDDIRQLRQRLGLTQIQFAARLREIDPILRTDFNAVSRYERGIRRPDPHVAAALEKLVEQAESRSNDC